LNVEPGRTERWLFDARKGLKIASNGNRLSKIFIDWQVWTAGVGFSMPTILHGPTLCGDADR